MELPEHLLPEKAVSDVTVDVVSEAELDDNTAVSLPVSDDIRKIASDLGLVTLNGDMMAAMRKVGISVESSGTVRTANGFTYVTLGALTQIFLKATSKALADDLSATQREKMIRALGYLANSIDKQTRTMKLESNEKPVEADGGRKSFQPHQHVHFHNHTPKAVDKAPVPA